MSATLFMSEFNIKFYIKNVEREANILEQVMKSFVNANIFPIKLCGQSSEMGIPGNGMGFYWILRRALSQLLSA
jgi:hypothetical protein